MRNLFSRAFPEKLGEEAFRAGMIILGLMCEIVHVFLYNWWHNLIAYIESCNIKEIKFYQFLLHLWSPLMISYRLIHQMIIFYKMYEKMEMNLIKSSQGHFLAFLNPPHNSLGESLCQWDKILCFRSTSAQSLSLSTSSMIFDTVGSRFRAFKLFCRVWILDPNLLLCSSISLGSPSCSKIDSWLSSLNKTIWRVSWLCLTKK